MSDMPSSTSRSSAGIGLFVTAAFVYLLDVFLIFYIPVEQCITQPSGTRRGRFVEHYLCSPTLLDDGLSGVARFVTIWAPLAILVYAFINARRRKGRAA